MSEARIGLNNLYWVQYHGKTALPLLLPSNPNKKKTLLYVHTVLKNKDNLTIDEIEIACHEVALFKAAGGGARLFLYIYLPLPVCAFIGYTV